MKATLLVNQVFIMRRTFAVISFSLVLASAATSFTGLPSARAPEGPSVAVSQGPTFLIPATDGYGTAECLSGGEACGQVVADAWCEAHGFRQAKSFGRALPEDVTGSIERAAATTERIERPLSITCTL